jgi:enterochelin esterase-like enzyme
VRVHHPLAAHLVLRTSADWTHDLPPAALPDLTTAEFRLPPGTPAWAAKACLRGDEELLWAGGLDVPLAGGAKGLDLYPQFAPTRHGTVSDRWEVPGHDGSPAHSVRVYLPPDYEAHPSRRYPVVYMQDGHNLFYPAESFAGQTWEVPQTMDLLISLGLVPAAIVVGIYPTRRMEEYTQPGYTRYGRWIVETLKPLVDAAYRTRRDAGSTSVMGSSLGGVVSFYLAWQWPQVFGAAACQSSTFGWRDNLIARVRHEPRRPVRIYLDSGGMGDNSYATRNMGQALAGRGYSEGRELAFHTFAGAGHNERAWATRLHLPLQFLLGAPRPRTS